jgi:hypothetical protein
LRASKGKDEEEGILYEAGDNNNDNVDDDNNGDDDDDDDNDEDDEDEKNEDDDDIVEENTRISEFEENSMKNEFGGDKNQPEIDRYHGQNTPGKPLVVDRNTFLSPL